MTRVSFRAPCARVACAIALLALPPIALAARHASALPPVPPALHSLIKSGRIKVLNRFLTDVPGMTGYIVRYEGRLAIVYGEHGYLFTGELISPQGTDMNARYRQRYASMGDADVIRRVESVGHLIVEGSAHAPLMYAFIDPNCSFCYRFYHMAEPLIASGRLQVRWVLVGFLQKTSVARAAAILAAADPASALRIDEERFDVAREHGGIAPAKRIGHPLNVALKAHLDAMSDAGGNGTPTLLYRKSSGHWGTQVGLPPQKWLDQYAHASGTR